MISRKLAQFAAIVAGGSLALSACSSSSGTTETNAAGLSVVTTTTQLADFASNVAGDAASVQSMLTVGASAHQFDPTPADLATLGNADVLIVNGAGLDEFIDSAIEASGFSGELIDASAGVDLELAREITAEAEHEDEHAHDEEHAHDQSLNPHLWTSPAFAIDMVQEITRGLVAADPAQAAVFEENSLAYQQQLELLDAWVAEQFARVPAEDRVLVTGHDSLRYFVHDYDITFAGALLPSFEDNAEPSAAEIDEVVAAIRESGAQAVFVESTLSPKLAQTVAKEAGVKVIDENVLFVDALGGPDSGAHSYIAATISNTKTLLEAWGVTPDPVPAELAGA